MLHNATDMPWPLSRLLLVQILEDRCSDFVCERIWNVWAQPDPQWCAGPDTLRMGRCFPRLPS